MSKMSLGRLLGTSVLLAFLVWLVLGEGGEINPQQVLLAPSFSHPLGTDSLGRDLLVQSLSGTATTVLVGTLALLLSALVGISLGLISGWFGGWIDVVIQRLTEVITALPAFVFVAIVVFFVTEGVGDWFTSSFGAMLLLGLTIGITHWTNLARLARGLVLRERALPYIESARAMGCNTRQVFFSHLLPNLKPALATGIANQLPQFLIFESFLSFVGLGLRAPQTSWGILLRDGWKVMASHPHAVLGPSLFIVGILYLYQSVFLRNHREFPTS